MVVDLGGLRELGILTGDGAKQVNLSRQALQSVGSGIDRRLELRDVFDQGRDGRAEFLDRVVGDVCVRCARGWEQRVAVVQV